MLIAYRREYTADAHVLFHAPPVHSYPIEFSLELTAFGASVVRVKLLGQIEYPVLPVVTALKEKVHELDKAGSLP